ncbi:hypothetical protein Tco_1254759 [Tanacetum coccineum]
MDQDSAHMVAASKVPMLKPGEYEIWRMRNRNNIYRMHRLCTDGNSYRMVQPNQKPQLLQKLLSLLEPFGKKLSQEDVNQKLLRILSPEWNTHAVVWRNKANLDTMSIDDLYNNLKVYEPEV